LATVAANVLAFDRDALVLLTKQRGSSPKISVGGTYLYSSAVQVLLPLCPENSGPYPGFVLSNVAPTPAWPHLSHPYVAMAPLHWLQVLFFSL
jgi:hypothetical protein